MFAYAVQISVFAGLVTVFAVLGVDQFIYGPSAIDKSIGAGWLITAVVDLLWIVYFTSPPDSHLIRLPSTFASYGQFSGRDRTEPVERNQNPFILAPPNHSGDASGAEALKGLGLDANHFDNIAAVDIDRVAEERMRGPEGTSGYDVDDDVHRRESRTKSGISSMYASTAPRSSGVMDGAHGVGREGSALGSERAKSRPTSVGPEAPPEQPHLKPTPSRSSRKAPQRLKPVIPDAQPVVQCRAEALFDCELLFPSFFLLMISYAEFLISDSGSADDGSELSFKKGEHLEIIDKSGKWWEARAADGRKGSMYLFYIQFSTRFSNERSYFYYAVVPSNYLQLL